jgi:hypothetical protein
METKKANIVWLVALILIFLAITSVAGYFALRNYASQNIVATPTVVESSANTTAEWKTYVNNEFGFEISYPSGWLVKNNIQEKGTSIQFVAPNTELLVENNNRACSDGSDTTECSADGVPADVSLSISPKSTISITESQGTVEFNNIIFIKYLGAFAGDKNFITMHNDQDFNFTCININACDQMLSTFKFTK